MLVLVGSLLGRGVDARWMIGAGLITDDSTIAAYALLLMRERRLG